jgi:pyocin large subunit-like protein
MRCVHGSYKAGIFVLFSCQSPEVDSFRWGKDVGSVSISGKAVRAFLAATGNGMRCEICSCKWQSCDNRFCNRKDAGFILVANTAVRSVPVTRKAAAKDRCIQHFRVNKSAHNK